MAKKNKFTRKIEDWKEESDGQVDALADLITEFFETATPAQLAEAAEFLAREILADEEEEE